MTSALPDGLTPSPDRTARLAGRSGTGCGGWAIWQPSPACCAASDAYRMPPKLSVDALDYCLSLSDWIGATGDTVIDARAPIIIPPDGDTPLVCAWYGSTSDAAVMMLSGGVPGVTYSVVVSADTAQGRTVSAVLEIPISSRALSISPPPVTGAVVAIGGEEITIGGQSIAI